jgi:hypothetical protein
MHARSWLLARCANRTFLEAFLPIRSSLHHQEDEDGFPNKASVVDSGFWKRE